MSRTRFRVNLHSTMYSLLSLKFLKGLSTNSFQALLMTYLHTCVAIEKVLTPNPLSFHLLKNRKKTLDSKGYTEAVLMDLSKAFNTINHGLLIAKLHAFVFSKDALKLVFS